jgi:hypothetical protein
VDDARRRELKRAFRERERTSARGEMILDRPQLEALLDHVDAQVRTNGCDDTLRFTRAWAATQQLDADELAHSLGQFGGYCDCEVVLNVEPEEIF